LSPDKAASFIYLLRPVRPGFVETMTPREEAVVEEHFAHLQRLLAEGRLILAGPCLDGTFGVVIFEATSEEEAASLMRADPAVRESVMTAELHAFRVSLRRG
jgi:uncharacterized protein YciI